MSEKTIALLGQPNSGKSTLFKKGYETYLPSHKDEFITELGKCTPPLYR